MDLHDIFDTRIANALGRWGVKTLDELKINIDKLRHRHGTRIGKKSWEFIEYLIKIELSF